MFLPEAYPQLSLQRRQPNGGLSTPTLTLQRKYVVFETPFVKIRTIVRDGNKRRLRVTVCDNDPAKRQKFEEYMDYLSDTVLETAYPAVAVHPYYENGTFEVIVTNKKIDLDPLVGTDAMLHVQLNPLWRFRNRCGLCFKLTKLRVMA